ncbi:hypothetical protein AOLI_G00196860 [Acnodon oligacanthus]
MQVMLGLAQSFSRTRSWELNIRNTLSRSGSPGLLPRLRVRPFCTVGTELHHVGPPRLVTVIPVLGGCEMLSYGRGVCWSLAQRSSAGRQDTPWTGHQFIAGQTDIHLGASVDLLPLRQLQRPLPEEGGAHKGCRHLEPNTGEEDQAKQQVDEGRGRRGRKANKTAKEQKGNPNPKRSIRPNT